MSKVDAAQTLAALRQESKVISSPPAKAAPPDRAINPRFEEMPAKGITFWLYSDDQQNIRQLNAFLSGQNNIKANDSVIVRAALSLVKPDARFVSAVNDAIQSDRRRNKDRSKGSR